jgi:hypothetical protein
MTLDFLFLELPDPEQELSLQNLTLDTFTCFPGLPLEVRRMIWKSTLLGRRIIDLDDFLCT